jgi:hypothetical protein
MQTLSEIINNNTYLNTCVSNKSKDCNSLSSIVKRDMSQSDCIKLGIGVEKVLTDIILKSNTDIVDIRPNNKKGEKERDHLFQNEKKKEIYYAENKSNLNLDTEKSKSTIEKCISIKKDLEQKYTGYKIFMFLLGLRYVDISLCPKNIKNKYKDIEEHLVGINEYMHILDTHIHFENEMQYSQFINEIADKMFD